LLAERLGRIEEGLRLRLEFPVLMDLQGRKNDSFLLPSGKPFLGFLLDATYEILLTYRTAVKDFCYSDDPQRCRSGSCDGRGMERRRSQGDRRPLRDVLRARYAVLHCSG
jgi:hypothetical protein